MKDWKQRLVVGALFLMARPLIGSDTKSAEIPFKLKEHFIVVKGAVGEHQDLNFVIDTGATSTYVSRPSQAGQAATRNVIELSLRKTTATFGLSGILLCRVG